MNFTHSGVDAALVLILVLSALVGLVRGFVYELLSLAGWLVAYLAARWFSPALAEHLPIGQPGSALNHGVTFACAFLGALIVWGLAARLVRMLIRATPLSLFDRVLGGLFGVVRGVVLCMALVAVVGLTPLVKTAAWQHSRVAEWVQAGLHRLGSFSPLLFSQHLPA